MIVHYLWNLKITYEKIMDLVFVEILLILYWLLITAKRWTLNLHRPSEHTLHAWVLSTLYPVNSLGWSKTESYLDLKDFTCGRNKIHIIIGSKRERGSSWGQKPYNFCWSPSNKWSIKAKWWLCCQNLEFVSLVHRHSTLARVIWRKNQSKEDECHFIDSG